LNSRNEGRHMCGNTLGAVSTRPYLAGGRLWEGDPHGVGPGARVTVTATAMSMFWSDH